MPPAVGSPGAASRPCTTPPNLLRSGPATTLAGTLSPSHKERGHLVLVIGETAAPTSRPPPGEATEPRGARLCPTQPRGAALAVRPGRYPETPRNGGPRNGRHLCLAKQGAGSPRSRHWEKQKPPGSMTAALWQCLRVTEGLRGLSGSPMQAWTSRWCPAPLPQPQPRHHPRPSWSLRTRPGRAHASA